MIDMIFMTIFYVIAFYLFFNIGFDEIAMNPLIFGWSIASQQSVWWEDQYDIYDGFYL